MAGRVRPMPRSTPQATTCVPSKIWKAAAIGLGTHRITFSRGGKQEATRPGGDGVSLELGEHAIADELRSLGLPDLTPLLSSWSEHFFGTFGETEKL